MKTEYKGYTIEPCSEPWSAHFKFQYYRDYNGIK